MNHAIPPYELLSTTPSATNLYVGGVATGPPPSLADVQFDPATTEVLIFVDDIPAGQTFHLRSSPVFGSPSGDNPADWNNMFFDFDSGTAQPFRFAVDPIANPTTGYKVFTGAAIP
jgi:hypothetical protein